MKRISYVLFLFIGLTSTLFAQKFTASANKSRVAIGETFQISFAVDGNGSNFKAPALNEFDVYSGPNQSTSMSFVNGVMSQSFTLSYIVAAKKEGKITILPATIVVGGKTLQSNSITLEVLKSNNSSGNNQPQGNNNSGQQNSSSSSSNENAGDNLFVRSSVSKTKAYQGEQITITHKVYTRYQLRGFQDIKFPDYNGFWTQDMPANNQQIQVSNENIDGVAYQVAELKRTFLFSQRSGKIEIAPLVVSAVVRKQSGRQPRDIFEQFFGGGYEDAVFKVKSKPITIDITPLPEANKPTTFSGAVGDFSFKTQMNKDKVKANDAINLTVTITGKGNIKLVDAPKVSFPSDFETYDPKVKENINTTSTGVNGTKTFEYLIIPRHEGDYKLENLDFSFFDPEKKQYIHLPSPEFNIHVDKGDANSIPANVFNSKNKEDVKMLGNDIRYIKTSNIILKPKADYFFGSSLFYFSLISPLLAFLLFVIVRRKNIELNKDVVAVKSRKATKMAQKRLSIANQYLKTNNKELFYIEIFKALYGYLSDKLNIPAADLNKDHISEKLTSKNVTSQTIQQLISTLDNCEFARYAPSAVSGDLNAIYTSTVSLITKIENEIK